MLTIQEITLGYVHLQDEYLYSEIEDIIYLPVYGFFACQNVCTILPESRDHDSGCPPCMSEQSHMCFMWRAKRDDSNRTAHHACAKFRRFRFSGNRLALFKYFLMIF